MILEHIASATYGAVIVERRAGDPTKELLSTSCQQRVLRQVLTPAAARLTARRCYVLRRPPPRVGAADATEPVQRRAQRHGDSPLPAKTASACGCTSSTSDRARRRASTSCGTIFDRVWIDGESGQRIPWRCRPCCWAVELARSWSSGFPRTARTSWSTTTSPTRPRARSA